MKLDSHSHSYTYLSIEYQFCSKQCQLTFKAHPNLYLGRPGKKQSTKTIIKKLVKKRKLSRLNKDINLNLLEETLSELMGVTKIEESGQSFIIIYDLLEVSWIEIINILETKHLMKTLNFYQKWKIYYINFTEENERSNIEDLPQTGCH